MTRSTLAIAAALALAAAVLAAPAQAQNGTLTRSFVSSAGVDTNACTIAAPCATFAHAYTVIGANGIIAALDPGKYGPITITGPVTINGNGWAAITGPAQGNAITVNAVSGNVILTGLEVDGAGAAYNGIVFNTGDSLTVTNCVVQNFVWDNSTPTTGHGIFMQPTSDQVIFTITNTIVSNNGFAGFAYYPQSGATAGYGIIDHVVAANNGLEGLAIEIGNGLVTVAISNSVAGANGAVGIFIENANSAPLTVSIDNTGASNNEYGIYAENTPTVFLGRSVIMGNTTAGVFNATSPNNTFYSYQDNRVSGNGSGGTVNVPGPMAQNPLY
jgi:hypothetical protein